jgi:hypothetical protein
MHSLLKSAVLGAGLLMAVTAAAQAQSVASLPPTGAEPAPAAAAPAFYSAKIAPSPGNETAVKEEHYTPVPADNDPARHPYSAAHFGPAPN